MGIRISKDHLHPSVIESITSLIGDLSQLETTAKGNAVEAINELLANGGSKEELEALIAEIAEGKELIANAIGEPLTAEESFDEMSNDINSLLSTFKTNMMNNGVTVESGDKFKSLIDKIATMVEEGEGKGIQFASGTGTVISLPELSTNGDFIQVDNLSFKPNIILAHFDKNTHVFFDSTDVDNNNGEGYFLINSAGNTRTTLDDDSIVTDSGFRLWIYGLSREGLEYNWVAIGVGEEDTTLRDSLASILENKGVEVTEEDDMATLIEYVNKCSFDADVVNMDGDTVDLKSSTTGKYTFNHSIGHTNYKFNYDITGSCSYTTDSTKYASAPFEGSLEMSDITKTLTYTQSFNMWVSDNYGSLDVTIIITKYNDKVEFDFTITNNSNNVVINVLEYVISSSMIIYMK